MLSANSHGCPERRMDSAAALTRKRRRGRPGGGGVDLDGISNGNISAPNCSQFMRCPNLMGKDAALHSNQSKLIKTVAALCAMFSLSPKRGEGRGLSRRRPGEGG